MKYFFGIALIIILFSVVYVQAQIPNNCRSDNNIVQVQQQSNYYAPKNCRTYRNQAKYNVNTNNSIQKIKINNQNTQNISPASCH
jgi:hypothetical protein